MAVGLAVCSGGSGFDEAGWRFMGFFLMRVSLGSGLVCVCVCVGLSEVH